MQTDFVGIKVLVTMTNPGLVGSLVKASLCGSVSHVHKHTKITNSVTSVNRSMLTLAIMQTSMVKNGSNVNNVTSGFTVHVKCKMASMISLSN